MKKIILILSFMQLFLLTVIAQTKNVDIDNHWITYAYRSLPTQPQDPVSFYYSTIVNATGVVKNNISIEEIEDAMFIEGQMKTGNPDEAQLILELSLGNIVVSNSDISERKDENKDRSGKITVNYYYRVNVTYTFEASFLFRSGEQILEKGILYSRDRRLNYVSNEFSKRKDAADYWNNNREVLLSGFYRELSLNAAGQISTTATNRYGFKSVKGERDLIKITDEKKHNENEAFRNAVAALKEELQTMTPEIPMNRDKVGAIIEYFKSIPEKYTDPKHKADVHLRYAAYFNLCKIYLFLDEPENVSEYADLIVANGMDVKDGEKLKKEANELKSAFEKTGIKTRHFNPDIYF